MLWHMAKCKVCLTTAVVKSLVVLVFCDHNERTVSAESGFISQENSDRVSVIRPGIGFGCMAWGLV